MGIITSYFFPYTGQTNDPDPTTGLTSRDRHILQTTWNKLTYQEANLETGMAIFLNLFEAHPQYHQLFPFRDIPINELNNNNKFRAHCVSLMYAFTSIVDNSHDPAMLEQLLIKQAVNHVPRNVPDQAYWHLKDILMKLFKKSMTEEEVQTWNKFLDLGFGIMVKNAQKT